MKEYNNGKLIYILIPPINSWWIKNTEFGEIKLMLVVSLSFREKIYQLEL
jgi:hypothetical protein